MSNVISLGKKTNSGKMNSPEQTLQDALDDIGNYGALVKGKKILILALDDTDGSYDTNFYQAGMTMSQCIALCEIGKARFLEEMGF